MVFDDNSKIIFGCGCSLESPRHLHKNLCCGCSLESPRRGDSNEHPQHRFLAEAIIISTHYIDFYEEISKIIA